MPKNLAELCSRVVWKVEFVNDELTVYLRRFLNIKGTVCFLLATENKLRKIN